MNDLNDAKKAILSTFPRFDAFLQAKLQEGFRLVEFVYESVEATGHETLNVKIGKDYVKYQIRQGKGSYAGGYSHLTFGEVDGKAEII